jgi:hypothetical protein
VGGCRNENSSHKFLSRAESRELTLREINDCAHKQSSRFSGVVAPTPATLVLSQQQLDFSSKVRKSELDIHLHVDYATTSPDVAAQHRVYVV